MSTFTKYKKIEKPVSIERYSVDIVNKNSDIIDSELHKLELKNESQDNLLETRASKEALDAEASRAAAKENTIENNLSSEISRAQSAEYQISRDLGSEVIRASEAEAGLDAKLSVHDTSDSSHNDLRLLISGLTARLNALADSDDTTLDQLSEIVAYIKNNKSLIDTLVTVAGNKVDKISGKGLSTNDYTTDEKNKLNGIAAGAEVNVQADWVMADSSSGAYIKNKPDIDAIIGNAINSITPSTIGLGNVDNTSDNGKPVSVAQQAALDALYQQLAGYTDQEIASLIGGAPSTLDTLGKIAQAMRDNGSVVTALDEAIGKKASAAEFDSHVKDKANPHAVTKAQLGLGNVDNTADASKSVNYAGSAGNADTVDGFHASGSHSAANTCVVRDGNGFTNLFYINSSTPANEQSAISQIITTNGTDNYYRKVSVQRMKSAIGLGNVDNTADANKSVKYAESAGTAVDQTARDIANGNFGPGRSLFDVPCIELTSPTLPTPFIDFHYGGSTTDYTSRLIESSEGTLEVTGNLQVDGQLMHGKTPVFSLSGSTLTINF